MSLIDLDQMFDLDLALTTPSTTFEDSGSDDTSTTKPWKESNDSKHNHRVELLTVSCVNGNVCTICMEGFQSDLFRGKQVPCGHVFHSNCIDKWLCDHNSCPLCRFSVYAAPGQGSSGIS